MIPSLGIYRWVQILAGLSTASPVFFLAMQAYGHGQLIQAGFLGVLTIVGLLLPGFLMNRILSKLIQLKDWLVTTAKTKVYDQLPSLPFLP